jgi:transcription antitermination factor NusG
VRKNLNLEVFHPRLHVERATQRGVVRVLEPLFPGYIFIHCAVEERLNQIQRTNGISSLVHFGDRIPTVKDSVVAELQECFESEQPVKVEDRLSPGDEVTVGGGAFVGKRAYVLRVLPASQRVQILLDMLGGPTPVEVDRGSVCADRSIGADKASVLAARQ